MSQILYFQALKFSTPSSLSTSLVLADIFYLELGKSLKNENAQNQILNLPGGALGRGE
jgi:hypothetical protein